MFRFGDVTYFTEEAEICFCLFVIASSVKLYAWIVLDGIECLEPSISLEKRRSSFDSLQKLRK